MTLFSTGPIENNMVSGIRPTQLLTVKLDNRSSITETTVVVQGYYLDGTRTLYVSETLSLDPNQVMTHTYFADLDAFEFTFETSSLQNEQIQISVWGKDSLGQLVTAHRLVSAELLGATGSGLTEYGYVYNLTAQSVAVEGDVTFSNNGVMVGAIAHTPGAAAITLGNAGNYAIWFNVAGVESNQFAVYLNGAAVSGAIYGSGAGTQPNPGMVILAAAAGDVITLRNHSSASAVTLQTLAGGTQTNSNASVLIQKIS
jgi:hypothetical protein